LYRTSKRSTRQPAQQFGGVLTGITSRPGCKKQGSHKEAGVSIEPVKIGFSFAEGSPSLLKKHFPYPDFSWIIDSPFRTHFLHGS
jgi:hypothetical protein